MGRETYFPHLAILVPERQSCACLRGQYTLRKITGTQISTQINVPRLNLHKRPRHHRCPTSRDFVPWRFLDAGRHSAWIASSCRHPKTCTQADIIADRRRVSKVPTHKNRSLQRLGACSAGSVDIGGRSRHRQPPPGRAMCAYHTSGHLPVAVAHAFVLVRPTSGVGTSAHAICGLILTSRRVWHCFCR